MELDIEHRRVLRLRRESNTDEDRNIELSHLFSPENSEILKTARQPWWESFTSRLAGRFSLACCPICKSARLSTWMPNRSLGLKCARPHVLVFSHRSAPCALARVGNSLAKNLKELSAAPCLTPENAQALPSEPPASDHCFWNHFRPHCLQMRVAVSL